MPERSKDLGTTLKFFLSPRAGFFAKLFLLLAVVYVILPLDFVPDVAVVVGWIDDLAALLGAGTALLLALRRYQADHGSEALEPRRAPHVPRRVIETHGTEVR